jgi:fatty-acyl-CoA synthase
VTKATWRPPAKWSDALARAVALAPDVDAIVASDGRATFAELGAQVAEVRRALLTPLYCTSS